MPVMVTQMIETGEESGALDDMLDKVATFYDNEVSATVDSLTSILEPLIIVFMGACIGCIVVSLYLPMFDYVKLLQQLDVVEHREVQAYDDASDACAHEHDDQRLEYRCQAVDGRAHFVVVESRDLVEHVVERT